jgi:hypothetical protein
MLTDKELRKIILSNYENAKAIIDGLEEENEVLENEFDSFCEYYAELFNKNFIKHLAFKHCYCLGFDADSEKCEFKCVTKEHNNYKKTVKCSQCSNECKSVYESTCIPKKTRSEKRYCMKCLSGLHEIDTDLIVSQVESHEMDEFDVSRFFQADFEKLMYSYEYETFDDFPLFSRLTLKLIADEEYFEKVLKKRKRNPSLSLFEGENEFYEHDKMYVADFDVLSTLIFCLERKGLSSFLIL